MVQGTWLLDGIQILVQEVALNCGGDVCRVPL